MPVQGKVAVVTGSNSGIGLGVAEALAERGARVVLCSFTDQPEDHALARRIADGAGARVRYFQADMSDPDACRGLIARAAEVFATVEQIGGTVAFLCSGDAAQITGTTISVDGGWTAL